MGIGAGWKETSFLLNGDPFPSIKTRLEQLEEAIVIIRSMWTSSPATSQVDHHYQIRDAFCEPRPLQAIPLLIGGGGERHTLRIVARYADWWNFFLYNEGICTQSSYP